MQKLFYHGMDKAFEQVFSNMHSARKNIQPHLIVHQQGYVKSVVSGIAIVTGLSGVKIGETLEFPQEIKGIAFHHENNEVAVVLLNKHEPIRSGDEVLYTQQVLL
jgi:F0F1-type ATP synthase alpha subunit